MSEDRAADISGAVVPHAVLPGPEVGGVRATFRDAEYQRQFEDSGCVVIDFLDPGVIDEITAVWQRVGPAPGDPQDGLFPGNASASTEWKREVIAAVTPIVADRLNEIFDDHHIFHLTFMTKWPGPDGKLQPHQDSTMVHQEGTFRGANVWFPLNLRTEPGAPEQGLLRVVRGSNRIATSGWYRARGGFVPSGFEDAEEIIPESFAEPIATVPGQAIVIDHRLIHCSPPNESDEPRLVLTIGLRPAEASSIHVECDPEGKVEFRLVDDEYFILHPDVDPASYPLVAEMQRQDPPVLKVEDFESLTGKEAIAPTAPSPPPPPATVAPTPPVATAPAAITRPLRYLQRLRPPPRHPHPVLRNPVWDRRLRRDGFVKVPLMSEAAAANLRAEFGRLHGWDGEGFQVDFWSPDSDYRRATSAAIAKATDEALSRMYVGYEPFLRNFLVKWPSTVRAEDFPQLPHRDWMYTDERAGQRSWVTWLALEDIDRDNGQLQVVRGSHRIDDMLRGSNLEAEWLTYAEVWEPRVLTVPVLAGEAVILDSAVVHCSFPNFSTEPRVAVAVPMRPTGGQLLHYRNVGDGQAAKYAIDEDFFFTEHADQLLATAPDLPLLGYEPIKERSFSKRELALLLDRAPLALVDRVATYRRKRQEANA